MKYTEGGRVTEEWLAELEGAAGRWPRPWTMGVGSYVMKALIEELRELRAQVADERAAKGIAADAADRFRDVLSDALGYVSENPGDDVLVARLREHFGRTGPEPTRWRDFLAGALARVGRQGTGTDTSTVRTEWGLMLDCAANGCTEVHDDDGDVLPRTGDVRPSTERVNGHAVRVVARTVTTSDWREDR